MGTKEQRQKEFASWYEKVLAGCKSLGVELTDEFQENVIGITLHLYETEEPPVEAARILVAKVRSLEVAVVRRGNCRERSQKNWELRASRR